MKKQLILALALSTLSLFACEEEPVALYPESNPATSLNISSISPEFGAPGTAVIISGENFGASMSENYVTFSGAYAEVIEVQPGKVKVHVPKNLAPGLHTINLSANGFTSTSTNLFTVE